MTIELDDFLALEPLLIERLKDRVSLVPERHVMAAADLAGMREDSQPKPALHVIYDGYEVPRTQPANRRATVRHHWLVVVVVKHVRRTGSAARAEAGPIATQVVAALQGWQPEGMSFLLDLAQPRYKPNYTPGAAYLPLGFTHDIITHGKE